MIYKIGWSVDKDIEVIGKWDKFEYNNFMICENGKKLRFFNYCFNRKINIKFVNKIL